ncbi:MAG: class I SAM-dependent methyltransferase [Patescibacteria group bacterium]|jgi:ubiquinone/menaquinone biosynthesis C-methylase UbiE|nr:class I SAM-dependent methyltransferase [Patescibacteria group bacterium]
MNQEKINQNKKEGLGMYFSPEIAEKFAELEQNDKNFRVAQIVDGIIMQETKELDRPVYSAELGGGAHPDRYHEFFAKLLNEPRGHIDWVDVSSYMLELAKKYLETEEYEKRKEVTSFIKSDILEYLRVLDDEKLDISIMKYTIDHLDNLDALFELLSKKLKQKGKLVATMGNLSPELKSYSTNARYLYNGELFSDNKIKILKDGDNFTVKLFKISGEPNSGYLEGAETVKYYHSADKIKELAEAHGFEIYLGDWKGLLNKEVQEGEEMDQDVLVLTKK